MKTGIIYIIKNKINNKVYIGQTTTDLSTRFKEHLRRTNKGENRKIYNAIRKYGKENFYIETLEKDIPICKLDKKEMSYIEKHNSCSMGYNTTKGGDGRVINKKYDEDRIISLYKRGKSQREIGKCYGVSGTTISRLLKKKGIETRHDGNKYEQFGIEFVRLWNQGITINEMARMFKVDERTIRRNAKRLGLHRRKCR